MKTQKIVLALWALVLTSSAHAAEFVVDRTDDTAGATACTVAANDCSLRGAVIAANNAAGADTITLPAGTYLLTVAGAGEDAALTGDLDVVNGATGSPITVQGEGAASTIIDGNTIDRVFHLPISTSASSLILIDLTVTHGSVQGQGGGILSTQGDVTLIDTAVSENVARVIGNTGGSGGGLFLSGGAVLTVTTSLIDGNEAEIRGGGINSSGGVTLVNTTVSGNTAVFGGGGLALTGADAKNLRNATVTENTTGAQGGGLLIDDPAATFFLRNTILAGNDAATDPDCFNAQAAVLTSEGFNLIGDETGCDGNFAGGTGDQIGTAASTIDPGLSALADNGGPTRTHALTASSSALDGGNNIEGCTSDDAQAVVLAADQRGSTRPVDGDGNGTLVCDIGAFELQQVALCGDGVVQNFEQCDDGNLIDGDGCSSLCAVEGVVCGNGVVENGEPCDDGNLVNGDGCSNTCVVEPGFTCVGAVCTAGCGDGQPASPEQCDDGNLVSGDGCSNSCVIETTADVYCAANPTNCVVYLLGDGGCGLMPMKDSFSKETTLFLILGNFVLLGGLILAKRIKLQ